MSEFYTIDGDKIILQVHLQPGAKKSEIVGIHGEYLKIRVKAPAVEGKANDALLKFLAQEFEVVRKDVVLTKGKQSRYKQVTIHNITELPKVLKDKNKF
ncbi:MAG: YggU family protein [Gammaproteobacteria bacterium]|nr:YggU family protein [Gammaproteobacteria bacterium]